MTSVPSFTAEQRRADEPGMEIGMNGSLADARTHREADPAALADKGREAIWKVVHEVWQLLDDGETDSAGNTTIDQARLQAVSDAMDELEALVPESAGPFWGGFPVNYLWPKGSGQ